MVTGAAKAVSKTCPDLRFSSLEVKMRSLKITVDIVWARDSPKIKESDGNSHSLQGIGMKVA